MIFSLSPDLNIGVITEFIKVRIMIWDQLTIYKIKLWTILAVIPSIPSEKLLLTTFIDWIEKHQVFDVRETYQSPGLGCND